MSWCRSVRSLERWVAGTESAPTRSGLRQSLEATLGDLLQGSANQTGYVFDSIAYGDAVEVILHKGAARFVVWLRPASDPSGAYKQTTLFKIGYLDAPPDRAGFDVLEAVQGRIRQWEGSLPDGMVGQLFDGRAIGSPNLELLAVRAGVKPACRYLVHPDAVDRLVREVHAEGLCARVTDGAAFVSRFCTGFKAGETTVVHVGRTEQAAARAAELERAMMTGWRRWLRTVSIERAFGEALGYPPCCTEAFLKVRTLPNEVIRFHALARTPDTAAALLNDADETQSIISHFVCRYDCSASLRYAEAVLAELGRLNGPARDARRSTLQGLVVRFHDGGALRCELGKPPIGPRYHLAKVEAFGSGPQLGTWTYALRGADGLEIGNAEVRILHGDREHTRLPTASNVVQIRLFA